MKRNVTPIITLFAAAVVLTAAFGTNAQSNTPSQTTPADSTASTSVVAGHKLFLSSCAPCHGADATGDDGPNLHKLGLTTDAIEYTVSNGIKGQMPSFAKKLKGDDLAAVAAYVRSLQ